VSIQINNRISFKHLYHSSVLHFCSVEKAKESTEKSKLLKKIVMKSLLLRKITRERRIKRHVENKTLILVIWC
jgi:hypothetical protein